MIKWFKKQPITIRAAIIGGIFVLFAALISGGFILVSTWIASNKSTDDNKTNQNESWKLVEINFKNWLEQYDRNFQKGYDSVRHSASIKVGLESSVAKLMQIEYLINKRIERDNVIDSFKVEDALHGGDTLQLRINKRLPINMKAIIKSLGVGPHYKGVILDTL